MENDNNFNFTQVDNPAYNQKNNQYQNNNKKGKKKLIEIGSLRQLFVFLTGWLGFQLLGYVIEFLVLSFLTVPNKELEPDAYQAFALTFNAWMSFTIYGILLIILLVILGWPLIKRIFSDFGKAEKIGKGIMYGVILLGATILYNLLVQSLYKTTSDNANETAVNSIVTSYPILAFFFVVIFGPVCEELTYRLGLFGLINKKNKYLAFILTALIFGLIHFDFTCFTTSSDNIINELLNLPSYMISGFILCLAYYNEESLATSITAHVTNNLVAYLETLLIPLIYSGASNVIIFR